MNKISFLETLNSQHAELKRNDDVIFYCPRCKHHKKKLAINIANDSDNHWGKFHCWACDFSGKNLTGLITFLQRYDLLRTYLENIKSFKWKDLIYRDEAKKELKQELTLPYEYIPLSNYIINSNKYWKLKNAFNYLLSRNLSKQLIVNSLFGISTDKKYNGYIIIPSFDSQGELNYFIARSYLDKKIKYINCTANKYDIIFNEINIDWKKELIITEGIFDALRLKQNVTCLLGSTLIEKSKLFIEIVSNRIPITLVLDNDITGKNKTLKISKLLTEYGIEVKILNIIDRNYKDLSEIESENVLTKTKEIAIKSTDDLLKHKIMITL